MLSDLGVNEAKITFWTSLLTLPYSLKPIWSPLLELYRTKREFVLITQLLSGICFLLIAFCLPLPYYFSFVLALFAIIGFSGATHDIATDGIYLSTLSKKTQAKYIGWQGAFFNLAKVLANGGLIWLAGKLIRHFQSVNPEKANTYAWMIIMGILGGMLMFLAVYHFFVLPKDKKTENLG
jgi:PAT family beta-lactamase induction signal transducer AmpG